MKTSLLFSLSLAFLFSCGSSAPQDGSGGSSLGGYGDSAGGSTSTSGGSSSAGQASTGGQSTATGGTSSTGGNPVGQKCPCPLASGTFCNLSTNTCEKGCTDDMQCAKGQICNDSQRQCVSGCRSDSQCSGDEICENLKCQKGCRNDNKCPTGQVCNQLQCKSGCRTDNQCAANQICDNLLCRTGCRKDDQCGNDKICDAASLLCRSGCRKDETCALDSVCNMTTATCQNGCATDARCSKGKICENAMCQTGCRLDADCPLENFCSASTKKCAAGCLDTSKGYGLPTSSARCPSGKACIVYQGGTGSACTAACYDPSSYPCAGTNYACFMASTWQITAADHANAMCRLKCKADSECGPDEACTYFSNKKDGPSSGIISQFCAKKCSTTNDYCGTSSTSPYINTTCGCATDGKCHGGGLDTATICYVTSGKAGL